MISLRYLMFTTNRIDIKGVVFDFDNTLVDTKTTICGGYKLVFSEIAKKFNIDKESLISSANHFQEETIKVLTRSKVSYDHAEWISLIAENAGIKLNQDENEYYKKLFYNYVLNNQRFSNKTDELLTQLKKEGKKLALLSEKDSVPGLKAERISKVPFHSYFDLIVIAGETIPFTKSKDGSRVFTETAKLLGLDPNEIVMVGDRLDLDIQNAKESGMNAILFTGYIKSEEKSKYRPDFVVDNLLNLSSII